jgi:hypothetical protein
MRIRLFISMRIRFFTWTRIQIRGSGYGYYLRSRILNKVWGSATLTFRPSTAPECASTASFVNLHGFIVSLHGSIVSLHGFIVSLHGFIVSPQGFIVSLHGFTVSLHGSIVSLYSSIVSLSWVASATVRIWVLLSTRCGSGYGFLKCANPDTASYVRIRIRLPTCESGYGFLK